MLAKLKVALKKTRDYLRRNWKVTTALLAALATFATVTTIALFIPSVIAVCAGAISFLGTIPLALGAVVVGGIAALGVLAFCTFMNTSTKFSNAMDKKIKKNIEVVGQSNQRLLEENRESSTKRIFSCFGKKKSSNSEIIDQYDESSPYSRLLSSTVARTQEQANTDEYNDTPKVFNI